MFKNEAKIFKGSDMIKGAIKLILITFLFLIIVQKSFSQTPSIYDSVRVESVLNAKPGTKIVIPIWMANKDTLAALTVPLKYSSLGMKCDSVSFKGTRVEYISSRPVIIDNSNRTIKIGVIRLMEPPIPPGSGLLAKVHFTLSDTVSAQTIINIDTFSVASPAFSLQFAKLSSAKVYPTFVPGFVKMAQKNQPPSFFPSSTQYVNEGDSLIFEVKAIDPEGDLIKLNVLRQPPSAKFQDNGAGVGVFKWKPDYIGPWSSAGNPLVVSFIASDGELTTKMDVEIQVVNVNALPIISAPDSQVISANSNLVFQVSASDPDKEEVAISVSNLPSGASFDNKNPGTFNWQTTLADSGRYTVTIIAQDQSGAEVKKDVKIVVLATAAYVLSLKNVSGNIGTIVKVPVELSNIYPIGGFEILVYYDASVLSFINVTITQTRIANWEYFTYALDPLAFGELKIVGIANIPGNSGTTPPLSMGKGPIAYISFQIINDPAFINLLAPVNFVFHDATDNTLSDPYGGLITQDKISYNNGGVLMTGAEILIGDINLNGIPYEIGDAVRFSNYFINPYKYPLNSEQMANSDINGDGHPATISDLVLLIRYILDRQGGGLHKPAASNYLREAELSVKQDNEKYQIYSNSEAPLSAGLFILKNKNGNLIPKLSNEIKNMNLGYSQNGDELRILIYSLNGNFIEAGEKPLFEINKGEENLEIEKAELADFWGNPLEAKISTGNALPSGYELLQNYPNPFNPETKISFTLPKEDEVSLKIYNVKGQLVKTLCEKVLPAGNHTFIWNGTDESGEEIGSGIYFFKLKAGVFTDSKKMALLR